MRITTLLCLPLLASVAACGGGSSGSPVSGASTGATNPAAANISPFVSGTSTNADVVGLTYNSTCTTTCPTTAPTSVAATSTVSIGTDGTGNPTLTLDIADGGASISHTFDTAASATNTGAVALTDETGISEINDTTDPTQTYDVKYGGSFNAGPANNLSYVTFGLWAQSPTASGAQGGYGTFAAGNVTPTSAMPVTESATYSGTTVGQITVGGNYYNTNGTVTATANFGGTAPSVNGSMAVNVVDSPTPGFWNTLTFNSAAINGNHFAGTITAPAVTTAVSTEALSGPLQGSFYGPQANEIGGVYSLAGASGTTSVGAFGAHK